MMTRIPATENFFQEVHNSQSPTRSPCHIQLSQSQDPPHPIFSRSSSVPKTVPSRSRLPPLQSLYLPGVFPVPKVSDPKSEAPNISPLDLCLLLRNSFLLPFITCNIPFRAGGYGQWQVPRHAILPASASNHNHYNKSST